MSDGVINELPVGNLTYDQYLRDLEVRNEARIGRDSHAPRQYFTSFPEPLLQSEIDLMTPNEREFNAGKIHKAISEERYINDTTPEGKALLNSTLFGPLRPGVQQ